MASVQKTEEIELKDQKKDVKGENTTRLVGYFELFKYADTLDTTLMIIGSLSGLAFGVIQPLISLVLGDVINAVLAYGFLQNAVDSGQAPQSALDAAADDVKSQIIKNVLLFVYIGIGAMGAAYINNSCWVISGQRQAKRVRQKFLQSVLRQDVEFFDKNEVGELTTRLSSDTSLYLESISVKWGQAISFATTFITGFVIAFIKSWELTLVIMATVPFLMGIGAVIGILIGNGIKDSQGAFAKAGAVAQETFSNIRTVTAYNSQQKATDKFEKQLDIAVAVGVKKAIKIAIAFGTFFGLMYGVYSLAFYYGSIMVLAGRISGGTVLNVIFAIIIGAFSILNLAPALQTINKGRGVAEKLFAVIESEPMIKSADNKGNVIGKVPTEKCKGKIEFRDVDFTYPSRPDQPILKKFNLKVEPGKTVALVGFSGSGKSSCIQLLENFYNINGGDILVDDVSIKDLNVNWLRKQIGLVNQEPTLFDMTIEENLRLGMGANSDNVDMAQIIEACKIANAYDFIMKLPQGFNSRVGEKGSMLSGGQRQRICIARSILKKPSILLCDEITAALDSQSERLIQDALKEVTKNCSTIIIAHRLSTIKDADQILVLEAGVVVESGTHDELLAKDGAYSRLVNAQKLKTAEDDQSPAVAGTSSGAQETVSEKREGEVILEMAASGAPVLKQPVDNPEDLLSEDERKKIANQKLVKENKNPLWDVLKMQKPDYLFIIAGVISAGVAGALLPFFGLVIGQVLAAFTKTGQELRDAANFWCLIFLVLMIVNFFASLGQFAGFGIAGERLTKRIRLMSFQKMLRMDQSFFDDKMNGVGSLTARLSEDADKVAELSGPNFGNIFQLCTSVCVSLIASFITSWQLTLIVLCFIPFVVVANSLGNRMALAGQRNANVRKAYALASNAACDAIANIRTVKSLQVEGNFLKTYMSNIDVPYQIGLKSGYFDSFGFAAAQAAQFWLYSVTFGAAYWLIFANLIKAENVMKVLFTLVFGAISVSNAATFGPSILNAKVASINFFKLMDAVPAIDQDSQEGQKPSPVKGSVEFKNVQFQYPTGTSKTLKGISFKADEGQSIALVGPSGSGKSTIVAALLRFYDVQEGSVNVDDLNVKQWNLKFMRSQMSIVSQEPTLFIGTIADNIAYGKPDATQAEIVEAAQMANIHDFISSLTEGYNTEVTNSQLSGGQRQRVCIARAMLMKPKVLLLDESTSALDSQSEAVVQTALQVASKGRTTLTIAHRLSTIQNADLILVMRDGEIVETGNHFQLLAMNGLYSALVQKQNLGGTK